MLMFSSSSFAAAILAPFVLASSALAQTTVGHARCFGDGTGAACPCSNSGQAGAGCLNSYGVGATLSAANSSGVASVLYDGIQPVILTATGLSPAACVFFQGSLITPVPFGDGLRCVGNPFLVKLAVKIAAGGVAHYPENDPLLSVQGWVNVELPWPCVRSYQVYYRNADPKFCTPAVFNLTNAVEIPWTM
jgi:hypothetical protein